MTRPPPISPLSPTPPLSRSGRRAGDARPPRDFSFKKKPPPLRADRRRIAEIVHVHRLYEGGVVGAEDEFAHGLESKRYLSSQYVTPSPGPARSPNAGYESSSTNRGTHRARPGQRGGRLLSRPDDRRFRDGRRPDAVSRGEHHENPGDDSVVPRPRCRTADARRLDPRDEHLPVDRRQLALPARPSR